jgi:hypothetical protein
MQRSLAGRLNVAADRDDIRVVLGNERALAAYRANKPVPEGTIIGRVAWKTSNRPLTKS